MIPRNLIPAFTLVELLATLAIIAILAALALPIGSSTLEAGRKSACAGNLRQIGMALTAYAADHNSMLPPVSKEWAPANQKSTWAWAIWTYAGYAEEEFQMPHNDLTARSGSAGKNIFICPSTFRRQIPAPGVSGVNPNKYSYGLNSNPLSLGGSNVAWTSPIPRLIVQNPSKAAMVTETSFCLGDHAGYKILYGLKPHGEGLNVLFFDGHVEWTPSATVSNDPYSLFWRGR